MKLVSGAVDFSGWTFADAGVLSDAIDAQVREVLEREVAEGLAGDTTTYLSLDEQTGDISFELHLPFYGAEAIHCAYSFTLDDCADCELLLDETEVDQEDIDRMRKLSEALRAYATRLDEWVGRARPLAPPTTTPTFLRVPEVGPYGEQRTPIAARDVDGAEHIVAYLSNAMYVTTVDTGATFHGPFIWPGKRG